MNATRNAPWQFALPAEYSLEIPVWKRLLDLACIVAVSPVLVPVMAVLALIVLVGSPGPVLFRQIRIGHRGRPFECFKFRTMHVGAAVAGHKAHLEQLIKSDAPMVKLDAKRDSRIIPFGWVLRATGLDELPQLINVLRGEMSLVGPRPCIPYEVEQFQPWQRERLATLPGLTGLWQVSGKNRTTFNRMMQLDIQYARTKTLWLDVKIMAKTFGALLAQVQDTVRSRKGAASLPKQERESVKQPAAA
jgi:lipopolysaccharide/colanic/teichoic acid biosynthesis glycosyltransferase